ncbi:MAG: hypothetical protein JST16_00540 [Bdellovibrionales bacterium]|nr:hypothetical protein [Bdellovibrionales bacterium]
MTEVVATLFVAIAGMTLYVLIHVGLLHGSARFRKWSTLNRLFFSMLPLVVLCAWQLQTNFGGAFSESSLTEELIAAFLLLLLLHNGYLIFYSINDRSLSVRMMVEFYRSQNTPLTLEKLGALYDTKSSYARRWVILQESGFIEADASNRLRLTPKGARLAKGVRWLKDLYGLGPGG